MLQQEQILLEREWFLQPDDLLSEGPRQFRGIYSVLVCTAEGTGSGANLDIVDSIVDRFEATTDITFGSETVTIEYVDVGNGYIDTPFYCIPITIGWYIYN